jgi:hypothetical protein
MIAPLPTMFFFIGKAAFSTPLKEIICFGASVFVLHKYGEEFAV